MIEVDCAAAYRNIPIKVSEKKYCMNFLPSKGESKAILLCHSRLPFGLSPSGLLWVRVYSVVIVIKRLIAFPNKEGIQLYIDDLNYITCRGAAASRLVAISLLHVALGSELSYHKIRVSSTLVILGFEWDLSTAEVAVTADRQARLVNQIELILSSGNDNKAVSIRDLQSIVGRAAWMARIICQFRTWLRPLYGRLGMLNERGSVGLT